MEKSLLEKLKALGVQVGTQQVQPVSRDSKLQVPIEKVVQGIERTTIFGSTFIVENRYPSHYFHGNTILQGLHDSSIIAEWAGLADKALIDREGLLFLDTETSGLSGGTGTFAFMVGFGFWRQDQFVLQQLFLREPAEEPALLSILNEIGSQFSTIVTFNGKSFDIPLLKSRYILNAIENPFTDKAHLDLLMLSRKIWRNRLSSRALGNLEKEILLFQRGEEEIPGWMVPELYAQYLSTADARPLAGVFYHNQMDILSLAALYQHLSLLLMHPLENQNRESLDLIAIARLYEGLGRIAEAARLYELSLDLGLPRPFFIQTLYRFASLSRKAGNWETAVQLWSMASEHGEVDACIELAKYYEHHRKTPKLALSWVDQAVTLLENSPIPLFIKKGKLHDLSHRKNRLLNKINNQVVE